MADLEKTKVTLEGLGRETLISYIADRLRDIKAGLNEFHNEKIPAWRQIYEARPLEPTRTMPFENASNLIVPIVAIHSDTLKARLMSSIFKVKPLWVTGFRGESAGQAEPLRKALEEFMTTEGIEPSSLDVYKAYDEALDDVIQYGTMFIGVPYCIEKELHIIPAGDGSGKHTYLPEVTYKGPRPNRIALEDFFMSPREKSVECADFKAVRCTLYKHDLEERAFLGVYDKDEVTKVLQSPDRNGPNAATSKAEQDSGIKSPRNESLPEWDIYECWFYYRTDGEIKAKIVAWFHLQSKTLLNCVYKFLPDDPFLGARLLNRDGSYYGRGMAEYLSTFQEEISQIHNQRRDAQTVANTKVWRVDPYSKLHDGYKIYPSAMLPAAKDEIEPMSHGEPSEFNIEEERLTLELAERRSGISPASQAMGAGNSKRGIYSAMGTLSVMQDGNTRTDMAIGDIRYFHTKLGRLISRQFGDIGINPPSLQRYGQLAGVIQTAFDLVKQDKIYLPINSSEASINREVEKQSDIMVVSLMAKHYQTITAMLMQAENQQLPPEVRAYMLSACKAANSLMKTVLKHFDYDDPVTYAPEVPGGDQQQQIQSATAQSAFPQQGSTSGLAMPTGGGGLSPMDTGDAGVQPTESGIIQ